MQVEKSRKRKKSGLSLLRDIIDALPATDKEEIRSGIDNFFDSEYESRYRWKKRSYMTEITEDDYQLVVDNFIKKIFRARPKK